MAYTKDYYHILGLSAPTHTTPSTFSSPADVRKAYKLALLAAHPDKNALATQLLKNKEEDKKERERSGGGGATYTVDDVKEAYSTLSDEKLRREYDVWYSHHRDRLALHAGKRAQEDFVLGLEVCDLGDFDEVEGEDQARWTKSCRCGDDAGFVILERELEGAEARGEGEVLVGCKGCSLWVRVGFEVEGG